MPEFVEKPTVVEAAGNKPKVIEEFFGAVNTNSHDVSIARMDSPPGWKEPGQKPEFDEYTLVLSGKLRVETKEEEFTVQAGQAVCIKSGEWVRYSTPDSEGAQYVAVCLPAFTPETVHRESE